jgi:tetratricopeptide (TPR) repeat protein
MDTQDRELAKLALSACKAIDANRLTTNELSGYALLLSVASHFGQSPADYDSANSITGIALERRGEAVAAWDVLALNLAAGSYRVVRGHYHEGIPFFERALSGAKRLGHTNAVARACGNLSMCHGRIGNYEKQAHFAENGIETVGRSNDLIWVSLVYNAAWAHAMLGNSARALAMLKERQEQTRMTLPNWAHQAHLLHRSDVYLVLGKTEESLRLARLATTGPNERLLSRSFAGPFARSIAATSVAAGRPQDGLDRIRAAREEIELDAIDRAEVTCAELNLIIALGLDSQRLCEELAGQLAMLPSATSGVLGRLGFPIALECAARAPK